MGENQSRHSVQADPAMDTTLPSSSKPPAISASLCLEELQKLRTQTASGDTFGAEPTAKKIGRVELEEMLSRLLSGLSNKEHLKSFVINYALRLYPRSWFNDYHEKIMMREWEEARATMDEFFAFAEANESVFGNDNSSVEGKKTLNSRPFKSPFHRLYGSKYSSKLPKLSKSKQSSPIVSESSTAQSTTTTKEHVPSEATRLLTPEKTAAFDAMKAKIDGRQVTKENVASSYDLIIDQLATVDGLNAHNGLDAARALLLEAKLDCHDVPVNRLLAHCINLLRLAYVDRKIDLLGPVSVVIEHLLRCPICAPKIYRETLLDLVQLLITLMQRNLDTRSEVNGQCFAKIIADITTGALDRSSLFWALLRTMTGFYSTEESKTVSAFGYSKRRIFGTLLNKILFKLIDTQTLEMELSIFAPEKVKTPLVNKPEIVIYEMHQLLVKMEAVAAKPITNGNDGLPDPLEFGLACFNGLTKVEQTLKAKVKALLCYLVDKAAEADCNYLTLFSLVPKPESSPLYKLLQEILPKEVKRKSEFDEHKEKRFKLEKDVDMLKQVLTMQQQMIEKQTQLITKLMPLVMLDSNDDEPTHSAIAAE